MKKIDICPRCGSDDVIQAKQIPLDNIVKENSKLGLRGTTLHHIICKDCGTIIRSYVENPQKLV